MRREFTNTRLDGKFINLQIRIICLVNRKERRKPLIFFDPAAIGEYIRSGAEYAELDVEL